MEPKEYEKQVEGHIAEEKVPQIRHPNQDFVQIPLGDTGSTEAAPATKGSSEELSKDVNDAPTVPIRRRKSIELEILATHSPVVESKDIPPKPERQSYPKPEVIYAPERLSNLMACFKFALIAITSVLVLFGVAIIAVATSLKVDPDFWNIRNGLDLTQFSSAANIAIVVGVVILIIGAIGLCGAIRESACMLIGYFIVALLLVILEAVAVGLVWSATDNQVGKQKLSDLLWKGINGLEEHDIHTLDIVQDKIQCCGVSGMNDYVEKNLVVPRSCFDQSTGAAYSEGCLDKLLDYLKEKAALIGGVTIAIILLQVGALGLALLLCCAIRQGNSKLF